VPPAAYYFVGSTGPIGRFLPLVIGTATLAREARAAFVIIDTTGLVHESGRILKNYKIDAVRPDVVVALERRNELAPMRGANRHVPSIKIKPSRKAHGKDDYEKIEVRRQSYARHFFCAASLQLSLESVLFQRTLLFTGEPIEIGGIEKMSKSKKNTVDPDDIIAAYGADTARWFMLSDSPPDRDVIWTEEGVQGAWRFVQRLWRLVGEIADVSAPSERPKSFGERALSVRKAAHRALANVSDDIGKLRFNRCVAHIYECANALSDAIGRIETAPAPDLTWALREAGDILVRLFHPMMPHLAEECWQALGHKSLVSTEAWPQIELELLVESTITLPVQVNGKKRADVTVPRAAGKDEVEAAVLTLDAVKKELNGRSPKKVIVVPQRIVNVVV